MKEGESAKSVSAVEDTDVFTATFTKQHQELEKKIAGSESVPTQDLKLHFAELSFMMQSMQKLYCASSPYLRIYYRKICQDTLQELQAKINDNEARLMPRKKFMFKGNKGKAKIGETNGGSSMKSKKTDVIQDAHDGPNNCAIYDRIDEDFTISPETASGKSVILSRLRGCRVVVTATPNTVHIADVQGCTICIGPVTTSVFVESAHSSTFQLACQQLRIHQTTNTDFFIHVTSKAIIEDSRDVRFGIYSFSYAKLDQDYQKAGLARDVNNWRAIDDFNWLVADQPSPHWTLIEPASADIYT